MRLPALLFLLLSLALHASASPTLLSLQRQSGSCSSGKQSGNVCCAATCGVCGGRTCGRSGMADLCCTSRIKAAAVSCSTSSPPCIITSSTPVTMPSPAPADPTCATGIRAADICCPKSCGSCGGVSCGSRGPGGGACCFGVTRRANVPCSSAGPPCVFRASTMPSAAPSSVAAPTTTPTAMPSQESTPSASPSNIPPTTMGPIGVAGAWENIDSQLNGRPQARHEACFVFANGKGYLLGGRGTRRVSIFDPVAKTWSAGPPMKAEMHHMQCAASGSKIYIAGAWFGGFPSEKNHDATFVFDTETASWADDLPALPEPRRRGGGAAVISDDKLWLVGGNRGGHGRGSQTLGWMDYLDLKTGKWTTNLPELPEGRDHVGGALVNGEICIAGGRDGGAVNFFPAVVASTYCYNFNTKKWRKAQDIPTPRAGASTATTCDGKMMIAGGEGAMRAAFDTVETFDGQTWMSAPSLVRERHGTGLAVSDCMCGHVFIASGNGRRGGGQELTSTEVYVPMGASPTCDMY